MQSSTKDRKSNIELLRILSMLAVIVLHYNNEQMGGGFAYAVGANKIALYILESVCICAVNIFLLISSYFLVKSEKRAWNKPVELIVQVMLFDIGFYLIAVILKMQTFSLRSLLFSALPNNYFVILYIACYFVFPMINYGLKQMGEENSRKMLLLCFFLFSCWPTFVDTLQDITGQVWNGLSSIGIEGSQNGYTIVNFVLIYLFGAYAGLYGLDTIRKKKTSDCYLFLGVLACTAINTLWVWIFQRMQYGGCSAWDYCNPVVIIESLLIFSIFTRMQIPYKKWINVLAKGAFTVYLLHPVFLGYIRIDNFVQQNLGIMLLHILFGILMIYLLCFLVHMVYECITRPIYKHIWKKGVLI